MKDVALVSLFFDYPDHSFPLIYNNSLKYFNEEDVYIARFTGLPEGSSYYEKLYRYKLFYFLPYVKEHILGKYKYMIFVDAKDTNFYRDPNSLIEEFLKFNKNIVFCGEKELWPLTNYTNLYKNKINSGEFKFLNSGGYVGYTTEIVKHLRNITEKDYPERVEDQSAWTIEYLLSDDIEVDSEGKIFFSTHLNKELVDENEGKFLLKGLNPFIIHDNGPYGDNTIKFAHLI